MKNKHREHEILLIDPDIILSNNLAEKLSNIGFDVLTANDSETALKYIEISNPSLILLDILMKGKDGSDILTSIKSPSMSSTAPVIILSSDTDVNSIVYGFLNGANDYIAKPFVFPEVLARVNNQIRLIDMQKELEEKNKELIEKNILLEQMATTDSLTGLFNKEHALKRLESEIIRAARYKEAISMIIIDIDNFKNTNDTYGHLSGDTVLKDISNTILNSVRDVDIAARYGGDEFFIICPNTDTNGAKNLADRIRINVGKYKFKHSKKTFCVTVSLGISSTVPLHDPKSNYRAAKLINEADMALYRAKAAGRNRIVVYENQTLYGGAESEDTFKTIFDTSSRHNPDKFTH